MASVKEKTVIYTIYCESTQYCDYSTTQLNSMLLYFVIDFVLGSDKLICGMEALFKSQIVWGVITF